jgi:hypothetical protein
MAGIGWAPLGGEWWTWQWCTLFGFILFGIIKAYLGTGGLPSFLQWAPLTLQGATGAAGHSCKAVEVAGAWRSR